MALAEKDARLDSLRQQLARCIDTCATRENEIIEAEQQLAAALAACKLKNEALSDMRSGWIYIRGTYGDLYGVGWDRAENKADAALAIQPDDSALKAWLGEPVAHRRSYGICEFTDSYGKLPNGTPLYSPKGLK